MKKLELTVVTTASQTDWETVSTNRFFWVLEKFPVFLLNTQEKRVIAVLRSGKKHDNGFAYGEEAKLREYAEIYGGHVYSLLENKFVFTKDVGEFFMNKQATDIKKYGVIQTAIIDSVPVVGIFTAQSTSVRIKKLSYLPEFVEN